MKRWFLLLVVMVVSGCISVASGPPFSAAPTPNDGEALVYIYRVRGAGARNVSAQFDVNRVRAVVLDQDGYTWFRLPAGRYVIEHRWRAIDSRGRTIRLETKLASGETYYFRLTSDERSFYTLRETVSDFREVSREQALPDLTACKHQPASPTLRDELKANAGAAR